MLIKNCRILNKDFNIENKDIYIRNGKIFFDGQNDGPEINASGLIVMPGLIDVHIHGFCGKNVSSATPDDLNYMSDMLLKNGVTSFLPTTTTLPGEELKLALKNISETMIKGTTGAQILGIYMEGPYLSKKYKGAQRECDIRPFDKCEFEEFMLCASGNLKMMTLAPEIQENLDGIKTLTQNGIIASVGHTNATAFQVENAIRLGASNATHLFNAMLGLSHREPGVVGAVFDSEITAELICDGHHINPKVIRLAHKLLGRDRLILISDAIPHAGMPDGEYIFDGQQVIVKDGTCTLPDGTLNGNVNSLFECVKRAVGFGIPFADAVYCASFGPAKKLGVSDTKGSIDEGKDADLVIMDEDFDIKYVIKNGTVKYSK